MPSLSACPSCLGALSVPDLTLPPVRLRCPLCRYEFPWEEIQAVCTPFPPDVEILDKGDALPPSADSEIALPQTRHDEPDQDWKTEAVAPQGAADAPPGHSDLAAATANRAALDSADLASHEPESIAIRSTSSPPRRRRAGWLGQVAGVIGGGAIGLALGYLLLLRFGGRQHDFLDLADRLPGWLVGGDGPESPVAQSAADTPSAEPRRFGLPGAAEAQRDEVESQPETDDVGDEPVVDEDQPAQEVPPGNREQPLTVADLVAALADADAALGCNACGGTGLVGLNPQDPAAVQGDSRAVGPCPSCNGKRTGRITPDAYTSLRRLAVAATRVDVPAESADFDTLRSEALRVLGKITHDQDRLEIIGRLAAELLAADVLEGVGIALAGTVDEFEQDGDLFYTRIVLFGRPDSVTVLSRHPPRPALAPKDRVLILGTIVENPRQELPEYSGREHRVVWGGLPLKLPAE